MRVLFRSQRAETVEAVADLLREHGISVRLRHINSYKSFSTKRFSYLNNSTSDKIPTLWVVHAQDQPRARALLRQSGLWDLANASEARPEGEACIPARTHYFFRCFSPRVLRFSVLVVLIVVAAIMLFVLHHQRNLLAHALPQNRNQKTQQHLPQSVKIHVVDAP